MEKQEIKEMSLQELLSKVKYDLDTLKACLSELAMRRAWCWEYSEGAEEVEGATVLCDQIMGTLVANFLD